MLLNYEFLSAILLLAVPAIFAANILHVMPIPSPSHFVWHKVLIHALAAKGHNVTVLSTDIEKNPPPNVHYIEFNNVYETLYAEEWKIDFGQISQISPFRSIIDYYGYSEFVCYTILQSDGIQKILSYPRNFKWDVIVYDNVVGGCVMGIVDHFNYPPLITATAFNNPPFTSEFVGGHKFFSYVPHYSLTYNSNMTFLQRAYNAIIYAFEYIYRNHFFTPKCNKMAREIFGPNMPDITALEKKTAIALVNSNPAVDFAEPVPPNVIQVGGLQIIDAKPLAKEIEEFIDAGKNGAILFSLGTNVKSNALGDERIKTILEALRQIPEYNFIWKFESDNLPAPQPSNVMIKKWLSQNDILAHPKIKAFISHSGLLGTHEATYHGVPIIGIPVFADQHRNLHASIDAGTATFVSLQYLSVESLKENILKVVQDPKYASNMKIRSNNFRDQPDHPRDRAVWWIEYLIRNPKPNHLRVPTLEMGYFKANHYDILLFFAILIHSFVFLVKKFLNMLKPRKSNANSAKKTN